MEVLAFIEVSDIQDVALLQRVSYEAYRASRRGRVILWLSEAMIPVVSRAMDQAVTDFGTALPGVEYLSETDHGRVLRQAKRSRLCILQSEKLSVHLLPGCQVADLDEGIRLLQALEAGSATHAQPQSPFGTVRHRRPRPASALTTT